MIRRAALSLLIVACLTNLVGQPAVAATMLAFPYIDRPNTAYSFKISGTMGGVLLSGVSAAGLSEASGPNASRGFTTIVGVTTGPLGSNDFFDLTLTGSTAWAPLRGSKKAGASLRSSFRYSFILDRAGRVVSSDAPGQETGRFFNAWDFIWSALARVRPQSTRRQVALGQTWIEEFSTSQTVNSIIVRNSFKSTFTFTRLERLHGLSVGRIVEKGEGMVTTYQAKSTAEQTRLYTTGQVLADPVTGLVRYAEWTVDTQPVSLASGVQSKTSRQRSRALTLTCTLTNYAIR